VDEGWFVPHFEKMLYDQAQIALNCLEAKQATGDERFAWLARDIFDYVARDLTSPAGGFYSAEDADSEVGGTGTPPVSASEHAEGAFYVWTAAELRALLGDDFAFFAGHFGIEENGNVPGQLDPHGEFTGKNILAQRRTLMDSAKHFSLTPEQANDRLMASLAKLRETRAGRPRPQRDDKIITAWNGLMISAYARGAQVLDAGSLLAGDGMPGPDGPPASRLLQSAVRAAEFVERELYDAARGVLFRCWREGRGTAEGFAEDYAYFIQGLLDLYEASFDVRWLTWAGKLQVKQDELFWDAERGGYFNSSASDPHLVLRLKEDYDGAEPAPSSVAALNLLRLAAISHDDAQRLRGVKCIEAFRPQWSRTPHAMPQMLCALELALEAPRHVVLAGDPNADDFRALVEVLHGRLGPRRTILRADAAVPWTSEMGTVNGRAAAYVCEEYACQAPVTSPAELHAVFR
jgi:uncharacterized protein YyaL (SSP411 family)